MLLLYDEEVPAPKGQPVFSGNGESEPRRAGEHVLFNVLGPLEVRIEGAAIELYGKPATLLALLLLHANEWVSSDQIVEALWGDRAPASANRNVKTYIWQLRRTLPPTLGARIALS